MLDKYIRYFKIAEICTIISLVLYFVTAALNTGNNVLDILSTIFVVLMIGSSIATYAFFILIKRHGNQ
jgi:hypothetical protein